MSPMMLCPTCWGVKCKLCMNSGTVPDVQLSSHFKLSEVVASQTAVRLKLSNNPTPEIIANLKRGLNELVEPVRDHFGPLHIDSGYRSFDVNKAVGGASASAHPKGWAFDVNALATGVTRKDIVEWLRKSTLAYDQVIFEGTWVHMALFDIQGRQRKQLLSMFAGTYTNYDPNDPRIIT